MQSSKLIGLIKILDKQEQRRFLEFLKIGYPKSGQQSLALFLYIRKYGPTYESEKLNRANIAAKFFKSPTADQQLNKSTHLLKTQLEQFLIDTALSENQLLKDRILIDILEKRNHPAYAKKSEKVIASISKRADLQKRGSTYLALFQLNYRLWSNINTEKTTANLPLLRQANEQLDQFYFLNKLRIILEYENSKSITAESWQMEDYKDFLGLLSNRPELADNRTIQLFLKALTMVKSANKTTYSDLKTTLFQSIQSITKEDARDIIVFLNNHNSKLLGMAPTFPADEMFDLFRFADENDLLIENERIRDIEYTNATIVSLHLGFIEWAKNFIEKYKLFLAPEKRVVTHTYVTALCCFYEKDYDRVKTLLNPFKEKSILTAGMAIQIRSLLLRAFFDNWEDNNYHPPKEQILIKHLTSSFIRYLASNKKLALSKKKAYTQFAQFLIQTINLQNSNRPMIKLANLEIQLSKTTSIALRKWLILKVQNMRIHLSTKIDG